MAIKPVVRYMLLCQDWHFDPPGSQLITVVGLTVNIRSLDDPPYPLRYPELCVLLLLTEGHGSGEGLIRCVHEESGRTMFETRPRRTDFGGDPLGVVGVPFRVQDCPFPQAGIYSIQFWYEGEMVEERPLRLR